MTRRRGYYDADRDARLEPNRVLEPHVPAPDWDRYVMPGQQPAAQAPVGDATRWGATLDTMIPATGLQASSQILSVQTHDTYSRAWSLIGSLSLHPDLWAAATGVIVSLEIAMGVGQAVINQRLSLFYAGQPSSLCNAQYLPNGGPYESVPVPYSGGTLLLKSFAAIGALIGQSINIRASYTIAAVFPVLPAPSSLTLIVAPYAAGAKL